MHNELFYHTFFSHSICLFVCLFVFRFGNFTTLRLLAHFSPLILRIELWQTNYWIMWQMCERLRLNKYFNRSEWWSINHRDKLGVILQAPSRHCACVRNETNEPFLLNNLSLTLTPIRSSTLWLVQPSQAVRYNHIKIVSIAFWIECSKWFSTELVRWGVRLCVVFSVIRFFLFFSFCSA